jgi:hypothetical protein
MRYCRSLLPITVFCHAVFGQALTPGFQFPPNVKPGDSPAITGTGLAGITAVTLKSPGKPDLAAIGLRATPTSVTFTVPPTASGSYTVDVSPGAIAGIPLTVAPTVVTPASPAPTPPTTGAEPMPRVYMPDGQLKSHSIRIYVTRDVQEGQNPKLRLLRSHEITKKKMSEATRYEPTFVAPGTNWAETVDEQQVRPNGTLLLFDVSKEEFELKAMVRVLPVVSWTEGGGERIAVGSREVNLGDIGRAAGWTGLIVGVALAIILVLAWRAGGNPLLLLAGVDGHLSLSQTQVACWTLGIGGVVLGYGLIRLDIPNIPSSLLVLMGASLATGGIGFFQDAQQQQAAVNAGAVPVRRDLAWGDLVRIFKAGQPQDPPELSLAKAQMLFWTVLLLVLFISKSILDGEIWDVPWPLVALMGFSQAGYLAPKVAPPPSQLPQPVPQPTPAQQPAPAAGAAAAAAAAAGAPPAP